MTIDLQGNSRCPKCGIAFRCGAQAGEKTCWCMEMPLLSPTAESREAGVESCYCPRCLRELLNAG